jgi:hypothetical protein
MSFDRELYEQNLIRDQREEKAYTQRQAERVHEQDCCEIDQLYERIASLEAQLAATKLKWQTGKPPKIGYYWVDSQHPRPKSVSPGWWDIMDMTGFVWAGPIPEPEEEKP